MLRRRARRLVDTARRTGVTERPSDGRYSHHRQKGLKERPNLAGAGAERRSPPGFHERNRPGTAKHVFVKTYGCQMNVYDSERMTDALAASGYVRDRERRNPPISSCSTPAISAKRRPRRSIPSSAGCGGSRKPAQTAGKRVMVGVAGCVAQAEGDEILRRAPVVDLVVGPQSYQRLPELLAEAARRRASVATDFAVDGEVRARSTASSRPRQPGRRRRLPHRAGRLRQVLHLLRRPLYARRRGLAAGRRRSSPRRPGSPAPACARSRSSARTSMPGMARARTAAVGPRPPALPPRRNPRPRPAPLHDQPSRATWTTS